MANLGTLIRRNRENRDVARERAQEAYWDPFRLMESMFGFEPARTEGWWGREMSYAPRVDVKETKDGYVFKVDLPGVKESDVEVSVIGNALKIAGTREEEKRDESEMYHAVERSYGSFSRVFTLPEGVDTNAVKAELKNGVLSLLVPKRPEVQPRKVVVSKGGKETEAKA
jgi:HSP20 family protein